MSSICDAISTLSLVCRHDFTVVETIDFFADEEDELPPPMTRQDVLLLNKADGFPEEELEEAGATGEAKQVIHQPARSSFMWLMQAFVFLGCLRR